MNTLFVLLFHGFVVFLTFKELFMAAKIQKLKLMKFVVCVHFCKFVKLYESAKNPKPLFLEAQNVIVLGVVIYLCQ